MTAPIRAPVSVEFKATGVEQVRSGLRLVGRESDQNLQRVGNASRQIAGGVESIARAGKLTGDGLKQILAQGAQIAFTFGAAGPVVGALAIVGLAIYEHITQKTQEARDEINKTREAIEGLAKGDLMGAANRQQSLYSGDRTAIMKEGESYAQFIGRRYGVVGLQSRIGGTADQMVAKYGVDRTKTLADAQAFALGGVPTGSRPGKEMQRLIDFFQVLSKMEPEFQAVSRITDNLAKAQGSRDATGFRLAIDKARQDAEDAAYGAVGNSGRAASLLGGLDEKALFANLGVQTIRGYGLASDKIPDGIGRAAVAQIKQTKTQEIVAAFNEQVQQPLAEAIRSGMASTLGSAIADGITAGFEGGGITGAFKAAGKAILAGLGGIFSQMGQTLISYGVSMTALSGALWNPLTSGPAAIAAGGLLIALGSALGAVAHGRSGPGGGGSSSVSSTPPQIIDRGLIDPTRALIGTASGMAPRSAVNVTVLGRLGPGDSSRLQEMIRDANRRGNLG